MRLISSPHLVKQFEYAVASIQDLLEKTQWNYTCPLRRRGDSAQQTSKLFCISVCVINQIVFLTCLKSVYTRGRLSCRWGRWIKTSDCYYTCVLCRMSREMSELWRRMRMIWCVYRGRRWRTETSLTLKRPCWGWRAELCWQVLLPLKTSSQVSSGALRSPISLPLSRFSVSMNK